MSNTGRNKKLASFNCDEELWAEFIRRCQEKDTTATALLTKFIKLYLDGSLDDLDVDTLDKRFDERVKACVNEYLEQQLPLHLDKYLTNYQGNKNKKTNPAKEREFWSIQERAKYLGLKINANQRLKIEMFVNDAYKQRHGKPPSTRLVRGTQTFAYPVKDVDILDATIRGVVVQG